MYASDDDKKAAIATALRILPVAYHANDDGLLIPLALVLQIVHGFSHLCPVLAKLARVALIELTHATSLVIYEDEYFDRYGDEQVEGGGLDEKKMGGECNTTATTSNNILTHEHLLLGMLLLQKLLLFLLAATHKSVTRSLFMRGVLPGGEKGENIMDCRPQMWSLLLLEHRRPTL